ncbi:MAG: hypothetical protein L3J35_03410 [Bacteroidales bacterium]|nr:hypothetical protein [Bacteroidales bacterium]
MKQLLIILIAFLSINISAQDNNTPEGYVKYSNSFKFKDGIFESFIQVKENNPIKKSQIVTNIDYNSFDFFDRLLEEKIITVYDNLGVNRKIKTEKIWGFSNKGVLYINLNDEYNRIPVFGNISHFIANKTYIEYDPYRYNSYNRYNNPYSTKTVLMQYLLDFETGKIYDFNYKSVELLISKDQDLYEEFSKLSKRKKKKLQFLYVRKYNQKHPIYFPK